MRSGDVFFHTMARLSSINLRDLLLVTAKNDRDMEIAIRWGETADEKAKPYVITYSSYDFL
jgi:hypothetical protein